KQTTDWLFSQLPMFQRQGAQAFKKDLGNIKLLCEALGNPFEEFPSIHIAGTNGKGSSTHILAAILQQKGLKVGVYTSPHYKDYRERIKINGVFITEEFVIDFVKTNQVVFEEIRPSFFEITVAMAFAYFSKEKVDIAVIETGLGGRLDSTNIITPILSLITNIGKDHTIFLGETLPEIASEKAGIIKRNVPVVISEYHEETASVFKQKAKQEESRIYFAEDNYSVDFISETLLHSRLAIWRKDSIFLHDVMTDVIGNFQAKNLQGVLQSVEILNEQGYDIAKKDIVLALANVKSSTRFMGRMHLLGENPTIIADSGHNIHALKKTLLQIQNQEYSQLHVVLGFVRDKDIRHMLSLFPKDAEYYFTQADIPRALPLEELKVIVEDLGYQGRFFPKTKDALAK
ncbi:MAG: bifunctional folylpolyglutamate synthase/dihydrofolate synthase, partial [Saprospiraceae bacterium]